jgi:hypothetical protein
MKFAEIAKTVGDRWKALDDEAKGGSNQSPLTLDSFFPILIHSFIHSFIHLFIRSFIIIAPYAALAAADKIRAATEKAASGGGGGKGKTDKKKKKAAKAREKEKKRMKKDGIKVSFCEDYAFLLLSLFSGCCLVVLLLL